MFPSIQKYCDELSTAFAGIPAARKNLLETISNYIRTKRDAGQTIQLVYICTHNSRRSHFGQVWAQVAAHYYNVAQVSSFSGGTEATAFHPNAIRALTRVGFKVEAQTGVTNPVYELQYDEHQPAIRCFSKVYNDAANPTKKFAAIMTCSDAEENCPFIPGVELRIGTSYEDPKAFDNTTQQDAMYDERCRQIALETLYVFSRLSE